MLWYGCSPAVSPCMRLSARTSQLLYLFDGWRGNDMPRPPDADSSATGILSEVADPSPKYNRLPTPVNSGMRWVARWIQVGRRIIAVSAAQAGATAVTSALGFVFWWVAARFFAPEIVGFSAAATSAMMLLGTLSASGLGTMLIKELPSHPRQSGPLILSSALLAGAIAGVFGLALAVAAPLFSEALRPLAANWGTALLFAAGVSLTAITILVDQAVLGILREQLQVIRNTVFAASKLIALVGLGRSEERRVGKECRSRGSQDH